MLKKTKGQVTILVLLVGFTVLSFLLISSSYIASTALRGNNQIANRQLDEINEGGVSYAIAKLKTNIDYLSRNELNASNQRENRSIQYAFTMDKGKTNANFTTNIDLYRESDNQFNALQKVTYFEIDQIPGGDENKYVYLNHNKNACFQVTWDKDPATNTFAKVRVEITKVKAKASDPDPIPIQIPIESSTGSIGLNPDICDNTTEGLLRIPGSLIYHIYNPSLPIQERSSNKGENDPNLNDPKLNNLEVNGYGAYQIKVTVEDGIPAPNLQTKGIYYRLSYRTFEIKTTGKYGDNSKDNTRVIIQANYGSNLKNMIPQFKFIRWYEGDE